MGEIVKMPCLKEHSSCSFVVPRQDLPSILFFCKATKGMLWKGWGPVWPWALSVSRKSVLGMSTEELRIYTSASHSLECLCVTLRGVHTLLWRPLSFNMRNVAGMCFSKVSPHLQAHTWEREMPEHAVVYSAVWGCLLWQLGTWRKMTILPWLGE